MSRAISAGVIGLFILLVCSLSVFGTKSMAEDISKQLDDVYRGKSDSVVELTHKWEKYSDLAALYIDHKELEHAASLIESISETDNEQIIRMKCRELLLIMEHLSESQMPSLKNIL